jgi:hypothetical protein
MIDLATHLRRSDNVLAQRSGESLVLLDADGGLYYNLDDVGARIWELADGSRSVAAIASVLAGEYDAPLETIEADAIELLGELRDEGLVSEASPS